MKKLRDIIKKFYPDPLKYAYYIGFLNKADMSLPINERYANVQWINVGIYANEGWFADPFIFSVTDEEIVLFVEEMIYKTDKGILAKLVINRNDMTIKSKTNLLELDTHLSFPIFIKELGTIYVYPENSQSSSVKIYEYDELREELVYVKDIIKEPLVDTQIVKIDGNFYAFGVNITTGLQEDTKTLLVFKSDKLLGDYQLIQKIENDKCEERGAGLIYTDEKSRIVRPAQVCNNRYGESVILYDLKLNNGLFIETEIQRIEPDKSAPFGEVLHTFNHLNDLYVIDGFRWFYPRAKRVYCRLRGLHY